VAVVLQSLRAIWAILLQARASLSADTDAVALLDVLDVLSNLDGLSNNLMADDASFQVLVTCDDVSGGLNLR
jgi:hypothetical protein